MNEYRYKQTVELNDEAKRKVANYLMDRLNINSEKSEEITNNIFDSIFTDKFDSEDRSYINNEEEVSYECACWSGKTRLAVFLLANPTEVCAPVLDFLEEACWGYDSFKGGNDNEKVVEWLDSLESPFVFKNHYPYPYDYRTSVREKLHTYFDHTIKYL